MQWIHIYIHTFTFFNRFAIFMIVCYLLLLFLKISHCINQFYFLVISHFWFSAEKRNRNSVFWALTGTNGWSNEKCVHQKTVRKNLTILIYQRFGYFSLKFQELFSFVPILLVSRLFAVASIRFLSHKLCSPTLFPWKWLFVGFANKKSVQMH